MAKMSLDKTLIRDLNALLEETGLSEIEISDGRQSIRVARHIGGALVAPPAARPTTTSGPAEHEATITDANAIPSPMVGTVYLSPKPGDPTFVSEGDHVSEGQTLMIIEAMKVMNPIPAPKAGTVKRIIVSDSQPVEFGEPLLILE
jgi:acetyl-CoA carboxylase biotin carboxyl carrier protein